MPTCPAGHESRATDYCDECGLPLAANAPGPARVAPPPAVSQPCPSCGRMSPHDALFCEACGYDFTTGTMPRGTASQLLGLGSQTPSPSSAGDATGHGDGGQYGRPFHPGPPTPVTSSTPTPAAAPPSGPDAPSALPESTAEPLGESDIPTEGSHPGRSKRRFVAEVWIDPDWYRVQSSPDALPSPGLPEVFPLTPSGGVIGRASRSQHVDPEVDCGADTGCSRRQALLTSDGRRWWVEDLGSANGTFVGDSGAPLPELPIPTGRTELTADSRIYVGAWTRVVVRIATDNEESLFT